MNDQGAFGTDDAWSRGDKTVAYFRCILISMLGNDKSSYRGCTSGICALYSDRDGPYPAITLP